MMKRYHYCAMHNGTGEYRSGVIWSQENLSEQDWGYLPLKDAIGAKNEPHWKHDEFILISLTLV